MSERDYIELILLAREQVGFHAMNYIAVMFSYVVAAYFVGEKLSKFQASAITGLYAVFTPFPCMFSYDSLITYRDISVEYIAKFQPGESVPFILELGPNFLIILFGGTWLVSVAFMAQARIAGRAQKLQSNQGINSAA